MSAIAEAAVRVAPRAGTAVPPMLPFTSSVDEVIRTAATAFDRDASDLIELASALPEAARPRIVVVGIGRTPPKTTQSLIEQAVKRGLVPGQDIISTRYSDLRVGKDRGFVRLAAGTGADGLVINIT